MRRAPPQLYTLLDAKYEAYNLSRYDPFQIAASLTNLVASELCSSSLKWPAIFYLFGSIGIIFLCLWTFFVSDHPSTNRWISQREREFLVANCTPKKKVAVTPMPFKFYKQSSTNLDESTMAKSIHIESPVCSSSVELHIHSASRNDAKLPAQVATFSY